VFILAVPLLLAAADSARHDTPRFGSEARLVVVSATAVDSKGRPVRDLKPEEIQVFENGRAQKIVHFTHARVTSARLLILVDASGSMEGSRKESNVRATVEQILTGLDPEDLVALAGFDHKYWGVVAFTHDRDAIRAGLADVTPFGATALHDALDHAAHDIASHGEGRRAIIVVTDGVDTASQMDPDEVIARSRALDVPIYTLSVVSPLDDPRSKSFLGREVNAPSLVGSNMLARYAAFSGGASFIVSDPERLKTAVNQIVDEVKHQYRLGYDPPEGPPGFRPIEVRTKRKGVRVRTRSGYVPPS
jgi:Ca-activated chloride channel family protein